LLEPTQLSNVELTIKWEFCGWSEPAATNAPVEDEPIQPVLRMNILPARRDFFFISSALKFSTSPLLPTPSYLPPTKPNPPSYLHPPTYHPHPPSLHRQSSRDLERLWSRSWSSWSWISWSRSKTHAPTKRVGGCNGQEKKTKEKRWW
jgi:hypothetical protein